MARQALEEMELISKSLILLGVGFLCFFTCRPHRGCSGAEEGALGLVFRTWVMTMTLSAPFSE